MTLKFRDLSQTKLFHAFLYRVIRLYSATFRMSIENERVWIEYFQSGGRVLLCAWHQQFFAAIRHFQHYSDFNPALMISQSSDGGIIAGVAERTGWRAVRGSSSRGGKEALRDMIEHLIRTGLAAHIVDGPKGPAGIVKAVVIQLAQASDAVIVPFYISADWAWYFKSWDTFFIPKPFSRVILTFGDLIKPSSEYQTEFEEIRINLENTMRPQIKINPSSIDCF
jgi:hypothetical protein